MIRISQNKVNSVATSFGGSPYPHAHADSAEVRNKLADKAFAKHWKPNALVGNIYQKTGDYYNNPQLIIALESIAKTSIGKSWIEKHAPNGFKLKGKFFTDVDILKTSDGSAVSSKVRYNLQVDDLGELGKGTTAATAAGVTFHRLQGDELHVLIVLDALPKTSYWARYVDLIRKADTFGHEIFYHATWYEKKFLSGSYKKVNGNEIYGGDLYTKKFIEYFKKNNDPNAAARLQKKLDSGGNDQSLHTVYLSKSDYAIKTVAKPLLSGCLTYIKNSYEDLLKKDSRLWKKYKDNPDNYSQYNDSYTVEEIIKHVRSTIYAGYW